MSGGRSTLDRRLARISSHRKRELLVLTLYFIGILVCTGVIALMLSRAYDNQGLLYHLRQAFTTELGLGEGVLPALFSGTLLGLVALVAIDWYKRIQGVLLVVGIFVAAVGLIIEGSFVTGGWWTEVNTIITLIIGILLGVTLGGGISGFKDGRPWQFPRALSVIGIFIFIFILIGIHDAHLLYDPPIHTGEGQSLIQGISYEKDGTLFTGANMVLPDIAASAVLLYLFASFAGYDTSKTVMVLGPSGSGKTWLLTGLNYVKTSEAATDADVVSTAPQGPLIEATTAFASGDFDDPILQGTLDADHLWFRYPHGDFFRTEVAIESLDYPGEALRHVEVPEELETSGLRDALISASDTADTPEEIGEFLSEAVFYADAVVTLIPLDDYGENINNAPYGQDKVTPSRDRMDPRDYITKYARLAGEYPEKDFIPVIAKADYAKEDFVENTRHNAVLGQPEAFSRYISERILQHSLKPYMQEINANRVYPIYFAVNEEEGPITDSGNIYPALDRRDTQPVLRGADELLDRIGE